MSGFKNLYAILTTAGDPGTYLGVIASGGGTAGNALFQTAGIAKVYVDGNALAGDLAVQSASVAGEVTDAGATCASAAGAFVVGVFSVDNTLGAGDLETIQMGNPCAAQFGADINAAGQVTQTHLAGPLPAFQGGTSSRSGPGNLVLPLGNDPSVGTLDYGLVKIVNDGGIARAAMTSPADVGNFVAIGLCDASFYNEYGGVCGLTGSAHVITSGPGACLCNADSGRLA